MNTEFWKNNRREQFHFVHWKGADYQNDTLVLIHHGHGEHAERYQGLAQQMADIPADVRGFDCRGHGKTHGPRGHADGLDGLVADLEEIIPVMLEKSGAKRLILFGHSMGGAAVAHYLTTRTIHPAIVGAILSAPALSIPRTLPNRIKIVAARVLARLVPTLIMDTDLDPSGISRVPAEVERYVNDPLIHSKISTSLGKGLIDDGALAAKNSNRIEIPLLVYHGTGDPVVTIEGTREFSQNAVNSNIEYIEFPGYFHEMHHESPEDSAKVFDMIRGWLSKIEATFAQGDAAAD